MSSQCRCHPIFQDCHKHQKQKLSYEASLIVYLKPENASTPIKQELICKICKGCVWGPKRCANCGAHACQQCLEPFVKQFNACPSCAVSYDPRTVHKSVSETLKKLHFTCSECNTQFDYKDALEHMKFCIKYLLKAVQKKKEESEIRKQKVIALAEGEHTCCKPKDSSSKEPEVTPQII